MHHNPSNLPNTCLWCGVKLRGQYRIDYREWEEPVSRCVQKVPERGRVRQCDLNTVLAQHHDGRRVSRCADGHEGSVVFRHEATGKTLTGYGRHGTGQFHSDGCAVSFAQAAARLGFRLKPREQRAAGTPPEKSS